MQGTQKWMGWLVVVGLMGLVLVGCEKPEQAATPPPPVSGFPNNPPAWGGTLGMKAPEVKGTTLQGKPFDLASYKGKVVVVVVELAQEHSRVPKGFKSVLELQRKYYDRGVRTVVLYIDPEETEARKFASGELCDVPVLLVPESMNETWGGIHTWPALFVLNRKGTIQQHFTAMGMEKRLDIAIQPLL